MLADSAPPLLAIENLVVEFAARSGRVRVVNNVNLTVQRNRTLALVGESGCGKSVTVRSIMGLLPAMASVASGCAMLAGTDLLGLSRRELNRVRGKRVAMIFQEPASALNPSLRIGTQITEVLRVHRALSRPAAKRHAIELLTSVRIPEPGYRFRQYPFELSGGMLQRVMIAIALAGEPELLIADEPTTALDTSVQAQILALLSSIQQQRGMGIVLVSHDLGVVARMADHVAVMYGGEIVEQADVDTLFTQALHPYTQGLLAATPRLNTPANVRLQTVPGTPPTLSSQFVGCSFAPRCKRCMRICGQRPAPRLTVQSEHQVQCWLYHQAAPPGLRQAHD